jgi:hypothetical protein
MGCFDQPWTAAFATWFRIKILLGVALLGCIASMVFSGLGSQSSEGDFKTIGDQWNNFDWNSSVCKATPYVYLSPFRFTFNWQNKAYKNAAYCPWPISNTVFRLVLACLFFIFGVAIFFDTRFSALFASPLLFVFALLWYSAFVIDAQSLAAGTDACTNGFGKGTYFADLSANGFTMICNQVSFGFSPGIDLILFSLTFTIWRAWGHCKNRYGKDTGLIDGQERSDEIPAPGLKRSGPTGSGSIDSKSGRV